MMPLNRELGACLQHIGKRHIAEKNALFFIMDHHAKKEKHIFLEWVEVNFEMIRKYSLEYFCVYTTNYWGQCACIQCPLHE